MQRILDRLDAIEKQNKELLAEVEALRQQLKSQSPPAEQASGVADRVAINERRVQELATTKVEGSERFPISLTGMLLMDAYQVSGKKSTLFQQNYGEYSLGAPGGGATFNQSIIGLRFEGPQLFHGARVNGFLSMDFYAGLSEYDVFRLRRAGISFDWGSRSLNFAQDKTLIAPLEPTSFARVAVPPLSGAGNLWLWRPQLRYDERVHLTQTLMATMSGSVFETDESYSSGAPASSVNLNGRPALQGRFELKQATGDTTRFSVGIAGHASESHIYGQSIPSRVVSMDLQFRPIKWIELTGTIFKGENFANLGGVSPGINYVGDRVFAVHGAAGWVQLAFPLTSRLTLNTYGGRQINKGADLTAFQIENTFDAAGNILYRVAPNVVLGFEGARAGARYLNGRDFLSTRFDATVAYLF